jgi:hypothetical protein
MYISQVTGLGIKFRSLAALPTPMARSNLSYGDDSRRNSDAAYRLDQFGILPQTSGTVKSALPSETQKRDSAGRRAHLD